MLKSLYSIAFAGISLLAATTPAQALLTINNFILTNQSISFDISGTISAPEPTSGNSYLFLVDANGNVNYDTTSIFESANITSNISVNGSPNGVSNFWIENQNATEDRLTMNRSGGWVAGDILSGTFEASWSTTVDTAAIITGLEFRWGRGDGGSAYTGTYQGIGVVPEPSTYAAAFGVIALGFAFYKRRKK